MKTDLEDLGRLCETGLGFMKEMMKMQQARDYYYYNITGTELVSKSEIPGKRVQTETILATLDSKL